MSADLQAAPQWTGTATLVATYDAQTGRTTIKIPSIDWNGRPYMREIIVEGRVLDLGRETA